jgi:hypothetical protein
MTNDEVGYLLFYSTMRGKLREEKIFFHGINRKRSKRTKHFSGALFRCRLFDLFCFVARFSKVAWWFFENRTAKHHTLNLFTTVYGALPKSPRPQNRRYKRAAAIAAFELQSLELCLVLLLNLVRSAAFAERTISSMLGLGVWNSFPNLQKGRTEIPPNKWSAVQR